MQRAAQPEAAREHRRLRRRVTAFAAIVAGLSAASAVAVASGTHHGARRAGSVQAPFAAARPVHVAVLDGSGNLAAAARVAAHVRSRGYTVTRVRRADTLDYTRTAVYFPRGCEPQAVGLAGALGVGTKPLPGAPAGCLLYVIVGRS